MFAVQGWIAPASRDGEPWVVATEPTCPSEVSVAAFVEPPQPLLLHCFGGDEPEQRLVELVELRHRQLGAVHKAARLSGRRVEPAGDPERHRFTRERRHVRARIDVEISADGFDWYLGSPYEARVNEGVHAFSQGWVAAADKTGEAWIVPIEADCPPDATVETLADLPFALRLACFGEEPISLDGNVTCPDFGFPIPAPEPGWLTWDACYLGGPQQSIAILYPPEAERLTGALSITGHFDDARSTECRFSIPMQEGDVYSQDLYHRGQKQAADRRALASVQSRRKPRPTRPTGLDGRIGA